MSFSTLLFADFLTNFRFWGVLNFILAVAFLFGSPILIRLYFGMPIARFLYNNKRIYSILYPFVLIIMGYYVCTFTYKSLSNLETYFHEKSLIQKRNQEYTQYARGYSNNDYFRELVGVWTYSATAGIFFLCVALLIIPTTIVNETKKRRKEEESVKKAHKIKGWATTEQVHAALNDVKEGLHIGSAFYWQGQGHILTVGGSRSGKGIRFCLPALLNDDLNDNPLAESFVVLDPKGENAAVAAPYLKRAGYNVHVINPFAIPQISELGNARFNPFDMFDADSPNVVSFCDMIASALIPFSGGQNEHFESSAQQFISIYMLYMMNQNEEPKDFRTIYKWIRLASIDRLDFLEKMSDCERYDGIIEENALSILGQIRNGGNEIDSIYSTCRRATNVFKDPQIRHSTSASDFDLKKIAHEKTAIFVCINPLDLKAVSPWLRIFFSSTIRALTYYNNPKRKVVLLLDEFPTIGYLQEFEISSGFLAGYNVTMWVIAQDLTQMKNLYSKTWETFVNNAIIKHWLSVGDNFTADYVAKRMPKDVVFLDRPNNQRQEVMTFLLDTSGVLHEKLAIMEIKGMTSPAQIAFLPYDEINDNASPNPFRS